MAELFSHPEMALGAVIALGLVFEVLTRPKKLKRTTDHEIVVRLKVE